MHSFSKFPSNISSIGLYHRLARFERFKNSLELDLLWDFEFLGSKNGSTKFNMKIPSLTAKIWTILRTVLIQLSKIEKLSEYFTLWNIQGMKRCGILLRIFWFMLATCRGMPTYSNTHAKVKNWIFDVRLSGNRFEFGIIGNDFWSSTIWVFQI